MKPEHLRKLLTKSELCGIYHLPSSRIAPLQTAAESLGYACFKADMRESGDPAVALVELGRGLGFPPWYGANLDALNDCLTDFAWHDAPGYVIIIAGADALHARGIPFVQLNEVLAAAVQEWRERGVPFWVFYDMRADGLAALPTLA